VINDAVQHIITELNRYLNLRSASLSSDRIVQGNLLTQGGDVTMEANDKVVMSLVNVEEERLFRTVDHNQLQDDGSYAKIRPEMRLNLYLLFIANLTDYDEALKALSHIISFFQHRSYFEYADIPALSSMQGRLIFDLHSLTFEEQNHLWGALGAKYLPSVMYKMRVILLRDEQIEAEMPAVTILDIRD